MTHQHLPSTHLAAPGSAACTPCPPGTSSIGSSDGSCEKCRIGKAASAGFCEDCPLGSYAPEEGFAVCLPCPPFQFPKEDQTGCEVIAGYYSDLNGDSQAIPTDGVRSDMAGMDLEDLYLEPGFWRVTKNSSRALACFTLDYCVGGNSTDDLCVEGHTGPYCEVCTDGWAKGQGGCVKCAGSTNDTIVLGFISLILLMVFVIASCIFLSKDEEVPSEEKVVSMFQRIKRFILAAQVFLKKGKVQLKILASYFQITTCLAFNLNFVFPLSFPLFMRFFSIINFDFGTFLPVSFRKEGGNEPVKHSYSLTPPFSNSCSCSWAVFKQ